MEWCKFVVSQKTWVSCNSKKTLYADEEIDLELVCVEAFIARAEVGRPSRWREFHEGTWSYVRDGQKPILDGKMVFTVEQRWPPEYNVSGPKSQERHPPRRLTSGWNRTAHAAARSLSPLEHFSRFGTPIPKLFRNGSYRQRSVKATEATS